MRPTSKSPTAAETRDFFSSLLEEMDPVAVNGLDKAIENADIFAAEVIDALRGMRKAA